MTEEQLNNQEVGNGNAWTVHKREESFLDYIVESRGDKKVEVSQENLLEEVNNYLMLEIAHLAKNQQTYILTADTPEMVVTYYKRVQEIIEKCQVIGEALRYHKTLNQMIGFYLVNAKKEANRIIQKARRDSEVILTKKNHELKTQLMSKDSEHEIFLPQSDAEYIKNKREEADRYSRKRKLVADNHVLSAQREIDNYAEKKGKEIQQAKDQLQKLMTHLQEKYELQLSGAMESIVAYAQSEKINLSLTESVTEGECNG